MGPKLDPREGMLELSDHFAYFDPRNKFQGDIAPIQKYVSTKKEFAKLATDPNDQLIIDEEGFPKAFKHQILMKRLMSELSEMLIIDETGTGKTCTVDIFIEMVYWIRKRFLATGIPTKHSHFKGCIILVRGKPQRDQIVQQIVCVCSKGQYSADAESLKSGKVGGEKSDKDLPVQLRNITRAVETWYQIETFEKFAKKVSKLTDDEIVERYSDMMLWVDEAHLLRQTEGSYNWNEINSYDELRRVPKKEYDKKGRLIPQPEPEISKQEIYYSIWRVFVRAKRTKRFVTTATPIVYEPSDIRDSANLILPIDHQMPPEFDYNGCNLADYAAYLDGRVSYIRAADSGIKIVYEENPKFPYKRLTLKHSYFGNNVPAHQDTYESQITIYNTRMSENQTEVFMKYAENSKGNKSKSGKKGKSNDETGGTTNSLYVNTRSAANFVFPDGTVGVGDESRGFSRYISINNAGNNVKRKGDRPFIKTDKDLYKYSSKVLEMLKIMDDRPNESAFITDRLVQSSGLATVALAFVELRDYEIYDGSKSFFISSEEGKRVPSFCSIGNKKIIDPNIPKKNRLVIMTGTINSTFFRNVMEIMNSWENRYGDYVRVFLGSDVTRIGFSLNNVTIMMFLGGVWLETDRYQSESRPIRAVSHVYKLQDLEVFYREAVINEDEIFTEAMTLKMRHPDVVTSKGRTIKGEAIRTRDLTDENIIGRVERLGNYFFFHFKDDHIEAWQYMGERNYKQSSRYYRRRFSGVRSITEDMYNWYQKNIQPDTPRITVSVYQLSAVPRGLTVRNKDGKWKISNRLLPGGFEKRNLIIDEYMFLTGENRDRLNRPAMRVLKQLSVTCHIHEKRNIRPDDVDGSKACDYQFCKFKCASSISPDEFGADTSTYDIYYSDKVVNTIIDHIKKLFQYNSVMNLEWIQSRLDFGDDTATKFIIMALTKMIFSKIPIKDVYGINSYVRESHGSYYLTPVPSNDTLNLTNTQLSYYSHYHNFVHNTPSSAIEVNAEISDKTLRKLMDAGVGTERYVKILDNMSTNQRTNLLEQSVVEKYVNGNDDNEVYNDIIERGKLILHDTYVPQSTINSFASGKVAKAQGRPRTWLGKTSAKGDDKLALFNIPKTGSRVFISTMASLYPKDKNTRFVNANNFMSCAGNIRILIVEDGQWRDVNNIERHAYNLLAQAILKLKKLKKYRGNNGGVYGYSIGSVDPESAPFRIAKDPLTLDGSKHLSRDVERGRAYENLNDLYTILKMLYACKIKLKRKISEVDVKTAKRKLRKMDAWYNTLAKKKKISIDDIDEDELLYHYYGSVQYTKKALKEKLYNFIVEGGYYFEVPI